MLTKITALFLTTVAAEQIFPKHPEVQTAEYDELLNDFNEGGSIHDSYMDKYDVASYEFIKGALERSLYLDEHLDDHHEYLSYAFDMDENLWAATKSYVFKPFKVAVNLWRQQVKIYKRRDSYT